MKSPPPELGRVRPPEVLEPVDRVGAVVDERARGHARAVGQRVGADRHLGVLGDGGVEAEALQEDGAC